MVLADFKKDHIDFGTLSQKGGGGNIWGDIYSIKRYEFTSSFNQDTHQI